jgi:hypothetical protein
MIIKFAGSPIHRVPANGNQEFPTLTGAAAWRSRKQLKRRKPF